MLSAAIEYNFRDRPALSFVLPTLNHDGIDPLCKLEMSAFDTEIAAPEGRFFSPYHTMPFNSFLSFSVFRF